MRRASGRIAGQANGAQSLRGHDRTGARPQGGDTGAAGSCQTQIGALQISAPGRVSAGAAQDRDGEGRPAGAAQRDRGFKTDRFCRWPAIGKTGGGASSRPPRRRCRMKTPRAKNLQLAGIELVLPTVLCIDGRQSKGARTSLTVGYATGYVDTIVAPLVAEWLSRHFHGRFTEHGRGAEGDLAAEAFYDKLASHFSRETPFLAAIVSQPHNNRQRQGNGDVLSRFMSGGGLVRWTCEGPVRAFINPRAGTGQGAFEPLQGGIGLGSHG